MTVGDLLVLVYLAMVIVFVAWRWSASESVASAERREDSSQSRLRDAA